MGSVKIVFPSRHADPVFSIPGFFLHFLKRFFSHVKRASSAFEFRVLRAHKLLSPRRVSKIWTMRLKLFRIQPMDYLRRLRRFRCPKLFKTALTAKKRRRNSNRISRGLIFTSPFCRATPPCENFVTARLTGAYARSVPLLKSPMRKMHAVREMSLLSIVSLWLAGQSNGGSWKIRK